jgi:uncharacterized protein (DUF1015 family)
MATVKPFKGYRPQKELAKDIASRPYDVLSSEEAREEAKGNPLSFLHVVKSEIDLPGETDHYSEIVYQTAKKNLEKLISEGKFIKDDKPCFYIYGQTMDGRSQYGIVGCASVDDYKNNIIKKHELTRPDKEQDRITHVYTTNFNAEPVFFTFLDNEKLNEIIAKTIKTSPEYDFTAVDGIGHHFWVINNQDEVKKIEEIFSNEVQYTYVADGHHRTAAAANVGKMHKDANPGHTGNEEYNFFLAVHFPASQLRIIDYNRVVKDLNGHTVEDFVKLLQDSFEVENKGDQVYKPSELHEMSMYLDGNWYQLKTKQGNYDDSHPINCLDVTILSNSVLEPLLDIKDLRNSKRIDFVGGIRGLGELKKRVDSGEMKVAFALYPVSMEQLIKIADTDNIMPPKTTWFEPKLRSGLVVHELK